MSILKNQIKIKRVFLLDIYIYICVCVCVIHTLQVFILMCEFFAINDETLSFLFILFHKDPKITLLMSIFPLLVWLTN
jgi:hypothetical protein